MRGAIFTKAFNFYCSVQCRTTLKKYWIGFQNSLLQYDYEILIIDDQSKDHTFENALRYQELHPDLHITVYTIRSIRVMVAIKSWGYHYAQLHGFDIVLLLHGDGQYVPEEFERLIHPILQDEADAVLAPV